MSDEPCAMRAEAQRSWRIAHGSSLNAAAPDHAMNLAFGLNIVFDADDDPSICVE